MTLEERLAALDAKFTEFSATVAKMQTIHSEVFTELGAIANECGSEGATRAAEMLLKFRAVLMTSQGELSRAETTKSVPKKPDFNVQ